MIKTVYVDTSVIGGKFDEEFAVKTIPFWNAVLDGRIAIVLSDLFVEEVVGAPKFVNDFYNQIPEAQIRRVVLTQEAKELAEHYIAEKVVGKTSITDCQHIAIATVCRADVLVSWNFKHIVNLDRIRGYNSVNLKLGYPMIEIRTPNEIVSDE